MYAILDIETTGGKFNEEGITEIAVHRFNGTEVVDTFISLINPERPIQPYVSKLTGIDEKMVRTAPKFHQVAKRIVEITEGAVLVAHNAPFDYRILRTEFRRLGYEYQRKTLCTVDLSQRLIPEAESHSLGKLVRSLGIAVSDRHRANGDALATLKLFRVLLDRDSSKSIFREIMRDETQGELSNRQLRLVESVPDQTGVYYLCSKEGDILFLDNSSNMKRDVNQHFTGEAKYSRALRKLTREVRFEITGSPLLAEIKAHEEARQNRPRYKRKRKKRPVEPGSRLQVNGVQYTLNGQDLLVLDKGRETGERCAFWIRNEELAAMGFFQLNHQINNIHILENLLTPVRDSKGALRILQGYVQERRVQEVIELQPPTLG
ncbi:DNA polymerase-3 subunit epsilon [Robiginitalea myxolifaciens]|uniref:DNA polymerase-3 subunit epsilon n=1 Tax=Robiginitalea myxolifaciens TaxID=400055 RepID=A0A1I6GSI3_9FLAO|nr:exonuclease domain-containing protein [Robiginitalea myxolifaciens]SFR45172.1 DNA polymerase-3 subunit epsilon [Robiginitalea myxolifaciens]